MYNKHLSFFTFFIISTLSICSQVTIGADTPPEEFSVLQLESNIGGLRLNNLNSIQRDSLSVNGNPAAKGLVIYNTDTEDIEMWNGLKWMRVSPIVTANGVVLTNDTIKLGGALQNTTTIDMGTSNLNFKTTTGSVGIGTDNPQAQLDITGNMRLGNVPSMSTGVSFLVRNNNTGMIGTAQQMTLNLQNVAPGATDSVAMNSGFTDGFGFITVSTSNSCSRKMNTVFNMMVSSFDFGAPIVYTNGISREAVGQPTSIDDYSIAVAFSTSAGCIDGGDETQFNFTIKTISPNEKGGKIFITNNGNVPRNYTIKVVQTL